MQILKGKAMTIRKPAVRKRKEIMLRQIDNFANLSKKEQEMGLMQFMQFIGINDDLDATLEATDWIPPELDDESNLDTNLFD